MSCTLINRVIRAGKWHYAPTKASALSIPRHAQLTPASNAFQKYVRQQQTRTMGSVSAIDSVIFRTLFGTEEIRQVSKIPDLCQTYD
jgi:hypothetical protein